MNYLAILDGYKTFLAGLAAIVGGLGMLIPSWATGTFFGEGTLEGYQMIVAGVAIWGIGRKIEKSGTGDGK